MILNFARKVTNSKLVTTFVGTALLIAFIGNHAEAAINCFSNEYEVESAMLIQKAALAPADFFWKGFDLNSGPIVLFSSLKKIHPVLNVSINELKNLGLELSECSDAPRLVAIIGEDVDPPNQNPIYDFYKADDPRGNIVSRIAARQNRTTLYMSTKKMEKDKDGNTVDLPPIFLARIAVHEAFHSMFQFGGGFQFNFPDFMKFRRDIAASCSTELVKQEVEILRIVINRWQDISDIELRSLLSQALKQRQKFIDETAKTCLQNFAFWERIEGTAHFADIKVVQLLKGVDSLPAFDIFDGENELFYFTGSVYTRALERLFPQSDWHQDVNEGAMLNEVLIHYLDKSAYNK